MENYCAEKMQVGRLGGASIHLGATAPLSQCSYVPDDKSSRKKSVCTFVENLRRRGDTGGTGWRTPKARDTDQSCTKSTSDDAASPAVDSITSTPRCIDTDSGPYSKLDIRRVPRTFQQGRQKAPPATQNASRKSSEGGGQK